MAHIRPASSGDAAALHELAALTFPLACPAHLRPESIAAFVAEHLSQRRFAGYLRDPDRDLLLAEEDGRAVGYTMLVYGEPADPRIAAAVAGRPTGELSKIYVHPDRFGSGLAADLVAASVDAAVRRGLASLWLGVNQLNDRANRFYDKQRFARVGERRFVVGDQIEADFVRERPLA